MSLVGAVVDMESTSVVVEAVMGVVLVSGPWWGSNGGGCGDGGGDPEGGPEGGPEEPIF